jgi:hypothetical protein
MESRRRQQGCVAVFFFCGGFGLVCIRKDNEKLVSGKRELVAKKFFHGLENLA